MNLKKHTETALFKRLTTQFARLPQAIGLSKPVTKASGSFIMQHLPNCFGQLFSSSIYYYYASWKIGFAYFSLVCRTINVIEHKKKSLYYRLILFCLSPLLQSTGGQRRLLNGWWQLLSSEESKNSITHSIIHSYTVIESAFVHIEAINSSSMKTESPRQF